MSCALSYIIYHISYICKLPGFMYSWRNDSMPEIVVTHTTLSILVVPVLGASRGCIMLSICGCVDYESNNRYINH